MNPLHDPGTPLLTIPVDDSLVRGAAELEFADGRLHLHRLPAWARAQNVDPQLAMVEAQPSGVRLVMRTAATVVELDTLRTVPVLRGAPPRPDGVFDLLVDGRLHRQVTAGGGTVLEIDPTTGATRTIPGPVFTARFDDLPAEEKTVEIWLPHNEITDIVALRADREIVAAPADGRPVWLHHGSSISHGSNAASPTAIWPVLAAAAGDVQLINLGLGGSALLDPFTARVMRDTPADLISLKMGINVVSSALMRKRAFGPALHGFLDTIREGHPDTPLLVMSSIHCPIHEETPGPGAIDLEAAAAGRLMFSAAGDPADVAAGALTLRTTREELARIVEQRAADDPNLHHLDGLRLYGPADHASLPLPDRLHPDTETHRLIGERFAALVFGGSGPFRHR